MIVAAIDESGTHQGARALVVAVCAARPAQWLNLLDEWQPIAPPDYHASEALDRDNVALATLMRKHLANRRTGVATGVIVSHRRFKVYTPKRFQSLYGGAYGFAVTWCALAVGEWSRRIGGGKVAYVIERGHKGEGHMDKVFKRIVGNAENQAFYKVASHEWVGKGDIRTHPADLLANTMNARVEGRESPAARILEGVAGFVEPTPDHFAALVEQVDRAERHHKSEVARIKRSTR
jgi:hypothetical protein